MHPLASGPRQLGVRAVAHERVGEPESVGTEVLDQLQGQRRLEQVEGVELRDRQGRGQQCQLELAADHGTGGERGSGVLRERADPSAHDVGHRAGHPLQR